MTEAQGNGISTDGTMVVGYGTNNMGRQAFVSEIALAGEEGALVQVAGGRHVHQRGHGSAIDNDGDGLTDCDDPDCASSREATDATTEETDEELGRGRQ